MLAWLLLSAYLITDPVNMAECLIDVLWQAMDLGVGIARG